MRQSLCHSNVVDGQIVQSDFYWLDVSFFDALISPPPPMQVCVPFLLFTLGLDPKSDLSKLPSLISELVSPKPDSASSSLVSPATKESLNKENVLSPVSTSQANPDTFQDKSDTSVLGRSFSRTGGLFSLMASPRTPQARSRGKGDRYHAFQNFKVVLSGCVAVLQFLGVRIEEAVPESLVNIGGCGLREGLGIYYQEYIDPVKLAR